MKTRLFAVAKINKRHNQDKTRHIDNTLNTHGDNFPILPGPLDLNKLLNIILSILLLRG